MFDDEFDGGVLGPGWEVVGTGLVDVGTGTLDLTPSPAAGDQPTSIRRTMPVDFIGAWFRAEVDNLPSDEQIVGIISVADANELDAFEVVVDDSEARIIARSRDASGFTDLAAIDFDKSDTPWIGLREAGGTIFFERGSSEGTLAPFFEVNADVSAWAATLSLGADNYADLTESDDVRLERAAACRPR